VTLGPFHARAAPDGAASYAGLFGFFGFGGRFGVLSPMGLVSPTTCAAYASNGRIGRR
jgi:hypothetical protein